MAASSHFEEAVAIMHRLRSPDGCPWDREQTFDSIRGYTLEETYEVLDAIERRDWTNLEEELGDLLLQVLFYAEMADDAGFFTLDGVLAGLNRKLIRRHPHVFGAAASAAAGNRAQALSTDGIGAAEVVSNWHAIKQLEHSAEPQPAGRLAGVSRSLPALAEAAKLGSAAAKCGFDWEQAQELLGKVREEADEIDAELGQPGRQAALAEEVGDLLFTVANLARKLKLDPETTLRSANLKFRTRFTAMEQEAASAPESRALETLSAAELEQLWTRAKQRERAAAGREA